MGGIRLLLLLLVSASVLVPVVTQADRPDHRRDREVRSPQVAKPRGQERPRYHKPATAPRRRSEGRASGRWQQERQRFREATPAERAKMRERFEQRLRGHSSTRERSGRAAQPELGRPVTRGDRRELRHRLERMPEPERERIRENAARFQSFSDEDRNRLRGALRHLRELSPEERRQTLERLLEPD